MTEETARTLKARALEFARRPIESEDQSGDLLSVAEFMLAQERYAIEFRFIREICPLSSLVPLPRTPPFVLGIMNLRGQILSVVDLRRFFDLPVRGITELNRVIVLYSDTMELGIVADETLGMKRIARSGLRPPPQFAGIVQDFVLGLASEGTIVLDGGKILADQRIRVEEGEG